MKKKPYDGWIYKCGDEYHYPSFSHTRNEAWAKMSFYYGFAPEDGPKLLKKQGGRVVKVKLVEV